MNKNRLQTQAVDKDSVELLTDPLLNKGTAFSEEERDAFTLHGLLPPHQGSLDEQMDRRLDAVRDLKQSLHKYL